MEKEERIFVTYMPVPLRGNKGPNVGYHASLNYIDKHGNHHVVEAEPEPARYRELPTTGAKISAFLDEELVSDGEVRNRNSRFGRLVAGERTADKSDVSRPFEYVFEAGDLSREWDAIRASGNAYDPVKKQSRRYNLPGSEFELSNPLDERYLGKVEVDQPIGAP